MQGLPGHLLHSDQGAQRHQGEQHQRAQGHGRDFPGIPVLPPQDVLLPAGDERLPVLDQRFPDGRADRRRLGQLLFLSRFQLCVGLAGHVLVDRAADCREAGAERDPVPRARRAQRGSRHHGQHREDHPPGDRDDGDPLPFVFFFLLSHLPLASGRVPLTAATGR